jgi:hypothetical protein
MVIPLLVILIIFWLFGFFQVPFLSGLLFHQFSVSFYDFFIFVLVLFLIKSLPGIFRTIVIIVLLLWILTHFGLFAIGGLTQIFVMIVIFLVVFSFV